MLRLCCVVSSPAIRRTTAPSSRPFPFFSSSSSLLFSRRHQRSTSTRVRSSTWEEKTKKFEERQREQQAEAARAAQRRARYAAATGGAAASPARKASASVHAAHSADVRDNEETVRAGEDVAAATSTTSRLTKPMTSMWAFVKGGDKGRKSQPLNPLLLLERVGSGKSKYDPDAREAQRVIDAVNGLRRRNTRRKDPMTVTMTDEQKRDIVSRYAETRWYAMFYRPIRNVTEKQIRWGLRISHLVLLVLVLTAVAVVLWCYYTEMVTVAKLSPEDQRDYAYMVHGMRFSDIYKVGNTVLSRDDPLEALPPEVRLHLVIEACREKNWHKMDWDVELRKMHPRSAMEERDYIHCLYWTMMEVGRAATGNGALFNARALDVKEARQGMEESPEERDRFTELEPTALPVNTKRTFFS